MQFAIGLLVVLAAVCALGSFITQGQTYDAYAQLYGERTAGAIMALQLDDVFHAWWFVLLTISVRESDPLQSGADPRDPETAEA